MRSPALCALTALLAAYLAPRAATACIRTNEANQLLGWSADGQYALLARIDQGVMSHAEIHPTSFSGHVFIVSQEKDNEILVTKVAVGKCASFGDEENPPIIERRRGTLTEESLRKLKTLQKLEIGTIELPSEGLPLPAVSLAAGSRFAPRDVVLELASGPVPMPVPVYCVGSCRNDTHKHKPKVSVTDLHILPNGMMLYQVELETVCNGGTLLRLLAVPPPEIKVPKRRCLDAGG